MAKMTAFTTLSYEGRVIARAGKEFEGRDLPEKVLEAWAARGWCSPLLAKAVASTSKKAQRKAAAESMGDE